MRDIGEILRELRLLAFERVFAEQEVGLITLKFDFK